MSPRNLLYFCYDEMKRRQISLGCLVQRILESHVHVINIVVFISHNVIAKDKR